MLSLVELASSRAPAVAARREKRLDSRVCCRLEKWAPAGTVVALRTDETTTMLRLRTFSRPEETLLLVEGRLTGPWVDELARCWATLRAEKHAAPIRVDLEGVTFVSAAGKTLLARLHDDGALLIARACMTAAIIEEITSRKPERAEDDERGE
jgi:hypothetical protein